ncbi:Uma2 family endonuclease [Streptomonospora wellingtoniae]|uniref:Uma2 family endonuclease n=1 Tax=Streptomonospora wellingtoniae TaxID=3075544 RepID=A0ABU2KVC0_9ACTN|nr:Uma2 family endonuclease [Streptomonospora sp. DSM 45055]MDT0303207.1 Uma2 family endonuclease [Streptomonospora sp. DSM 45055]
MATLGDESDPTAGGSDMGVLCPTDPQARSASEEEPERSPSVRDWPIPPPEGYTAEDLDRIPDLPPHTELIDGSLVFVSPQKLFHMLVIDHLNAELKRQTPRQLRSRREMSVILGPRQRPEPALVVVDASAEESSDLTAYRPESVVLAVEVVSEESEVRDRERKPQLYAQAGIKHHWRVENEGGRPVVYVYELDPATGAYVATGIHRDRLKLAVPFDIDVDLAGIDDM